MRYCQVATVSRNLEFQCMTFLYLENISKNLYFVRDFEIGFQTISKMLISELKILRNKAKNSCIQKYVDAERRRLVKVVQFVNKLVIVTVQRLCGMQAFATIVRVCVAYVFFCYFLFRNNNEYFLNKHNNITGIVNNTVKQ